MNKDSEQADLNQTLADLVETVGIIRSNQEKMELFLKKQSLELNVLKGQMISHHSFGNYYPNRPFVPAGDSLQENVEDYIQPNPFY